MLRRYPDRTQLQNLKQDTAIAVSVTLQLALERLLVVDSTGEDAIPNRYYPAIQLELCHLLECEASQVLS